MKKILLIAFLCTLLLNGCYYGPHFVNYEVGSSEVNKELYAANSELFERYPDKYGWLEKCEYGDIPYLANADYIEKSLADGIFLVSTPEELASFNYFVNTSLSGQNLTMQLQNDIDLAGYKWAPMGWDNEDEVSITGYGWGGSGKYSYDVEQGIDLPFTCTVDGNGYTIQNMVIECNSNNVGFIGWETRCGVCDITFENASIKGNSHVGIITGQAIGGNYENCHVSGEVNGSKAGSMLGYSATYKVFDCTADVTVNGETFEFLSWNDKEKSEIVVENLVQITIDEEFTVTRPVVTEYGPLGWLVKKDGVQVLHRNAENELSYRYPKDDPGVYTIHLVAKVEGQYVPVSNTVEYTIE